MRLRGLLELCRVTNLPTVWLNVATAALLGGAHGAGRVLGVAAGISCIYCGGMAMNDCCDASRDACRRPDRPIPSGRVARGAAGLLSLFLFAAGVFAVGASGAPSLLPAVTLVLLVALYNTTHDRTPWAVPLMASCRFMIYVVTPLALSSPFAPPLLAAGMLQFGYVLLLTLAARHEKRLKRTTSAVPLLLAGIPVVDGVALGLFLHPGWLGAGIGTALVTLGLQRSIRGD